MPRLLHDPITGEELTLYKGKGEMTDYWICDGVDEVIRVIAQDRVIPEERAKELLEHSDCEHPVTYHDEVYWVE